MTEKMSDFKQINFKKKFRGYDTNEVDQYINNLMRYCQVLWSQVNAEEEKGEEEDNGVL